MCGIVIVDLKKGLSPETATNIGQFRVAQFKRGQIQLCSAQSPNDALPHSSKNNRLESLYQQNFIPKGGFKLRHATDIRIVQPHVEQQFFGRQCTF